MMGKYVGIEFLRFEYMNESQRNTEVSCRVEATALKPEDDTIYERAVLLNFSAESADKMMKAEYKARIRYEFEPNTVPDNNKKFLDEHYKDAFQILIKTANDALEALGQNAMHPALI